MRDRLAIGLGTLAAPGTVALDDNSLHMQAARPHPDTAAAPFTSSSSLTLVDGAAALIWPDVSREMALAVPAVAQAIQTVGLLAGLPLQANQGTTPPPTIAAEPDPDTPPVTVWQDTYSDLLLYGRAYWAVLAWQDDTGNGRPRPRHARRIDPALVDTSSQAGTVTIDGQQHYIMTPRLSGRPGRAVIVFDGPLPGGLLGNGTAIKTAYALETLADIYAQPGIPTGYLRQPDGTHLTADQVNELLNTWEQSRRTRSTAYLGGGLEYHTTRISPADLQLVEAREMSDARIAQLANLAPETLNARTAGGTQTYANLVARRRDLLDLQLTAWRTVITQRLSMDDLSPIGHTITHDLTAFLAADMQTLVATGVQAVGAGLITIDEWRRMAGLPTLEAQR